jgi:peptidoglycan hydrolase CwlO-like protein
MMKFQTSLIVVLIYLLAHTAGAHSVQSTDLASFDENSVIYSLIQESPQITSEDPDTTIIEEQGVTEDETREDEIITEREANIDLHFFLVFFTTSLLFLTMLLHLVLYFKFSREFSNSMIAIFIGLLFISYLANYIGDYITLSSDWNDWIENFRIYGLIIALHFLPYVLSVLTGMKDLKQSVHLVWLSVIPFLIRHFSPEYYFEYVLSVVIVMLVISGYFINRASNKGRMHLSAIIAGYVIVVLATVMYVLHVYNVLIITEVQMAGIASILYAALPLSFLFFKMNHYGFKYASHNQKMEEKSSEIEKARSQLKRLHDKLKETQEQLLERVDPVSQGKSRSDNVNAVREKSRDISFISEAGLKHVRFTQNRLMEIRTTDQHSDAQLNDMEAYLKQVESDLTRIKKQGDEIEKQLNHMNEKEGNGSKDSGKVEINHLIRDTLQKVHDKFQLKFNKSRIEIDLALDKNAGVSTVDVDDFRKVLKNIYHHAFESIMEKIDLDSKRRGIEDQDAFKVLNDPPRLLIQTRREEKRIFLKIEFDSIDNPEGTHSKFGNRSGKSQFTEGSSEPALIVANDLLQKNGLEMFVLSSGSEKVIHIELKSAD